MKILIVSDTHGYESYLYRALEREGDVDLLIHLGDVEGRDDEIRMVTGCRCIFISGNNDFFSALPLEKTIKIGPYRAYLTHGHRYRTYSGIADLVQAGIDHEADIVLFGHTHRPVIEKEEGVLVMNPGSLTYPRQEGRQPSYIIMELGDDDELHYEIRYLKR